MKIVFWSVGSFVLSYFVLGHFVLSYGNAMKFVVGLIVVLSFGLSAAVADARRNSQRPCANARQDRLLRCLEGPHL